MRRDKKLKITIETLMELNETELLKDSERDALEETICLLKDIRFMEEYTNKRIEWLKEMMKK